MKFVIHFFIGAIFALNCSLNARELDSCDMTTMSHVVTGVVNVATDNSGNPVELAFKTQGENDGRPVIVFCDPYLGIDSWKKLQRTFGKHYFTISYDPVGFGLSSKNDPTALDNVNGQVGYSYRQQSGFLHKLLETLDPKGPIIFVPVDVQGQVGIWYLTDYANDSYPISKLFMEECTSVSIVSDDPCSLSNVSVANAQQFAGLFAIDPETAAALLFGDTFATTNCPQMQTIITNQAIEYILTTTSEIFTRLFLGTFREDVSHLMADIDIPVSNTYGTTGDSDPMARRNVGITFFGHGFLVNPYIEGNCSECSQPYIEPFPNSQFITYPGHGLIVHLTALRKFKRDLKSFITDKDTACTGHLPWSE